MSLRQYDLTAVHINETDYIRIETEEHLHTWKVLAVDGNVGHPRKLTVERISSSDPSMKRRGTLTLNPGQPVMGMVIPEARFMDGNDVDKYSEDAGKINNLALSTLEEFLGKMMHEGFKAPYDVCVKNLQEKGALPPGDYRKVRDRLSRLIKANPELFFSSGTYIHLVNGKNPHRQDQRPSTQIPVEVSRHEINEMWRCLDEALFHALQSGLLTGGRPVKFTD